MTVFFNLRISIWYVFMVSDFCWDFRSFISLGKVNILTSKRVPLELQSLRPVDTLLFLLAIFHLILSPYVCFLWRRVELCIWKGFVRTSWKLKDDATVLQGRSAPSSPPPGACGSWVLKDLSPAPGTETDTDGAGGQQVLRLTLTVDPSSSPRAVRAFWTASSPQSLGDTAQSQLPPLGLVSTPDVWESA